MKRSRTINSVFIQQQGVALMVMMIILILGTAGFLVSSLGGISQTLKRDQKSTEALSQAKEALIAYAATQGDLAGTPRPGDLPCPDTNNDGASEGTCVAGAIGRLPYKTLGIAQLFDSQGESLWYSISGNFRNRGITGANLNSDTNGTLDVYANDGTTLLTSSSDKAVAIIFAPEVILNAQSRSTTQTALCSTTGTTISQHLCATNYLEILNSRNNATINGPFIEGDSSPTFNDRLLFIKASQLRPAIEKRVAGEIRSLLKSYHSGWLDFPFAATFINPNTSPYTGVTATSFGLLPIGNLNGIGSTIQPYWSTISPTPTFSGGSGSGTCTLRPSGCSGSACTNWRCNLTGITGTGTPTIQIVGTLKNIGFGMWQQFDPSASIGGTPIVGVRISPSSTYSVATNVMSFEPVTATLNSSGDATVVFQGTVIAGNVPTRIQLAANSLTSPLIPNWFSQNNWQQVMYYAASPAYTPGGAHTCTPYCVSLNGQAASAVVVATSGALSGLTHPSGTLSNYLEGLNLAHTSGVYETKTISDTFNDTIVTVTP